jgi:hypothetical protein
MTTKQHTLQELHRNLKATEEKARRYRVMIAFFSCVPADFKGMGINVDVENFRVTHGEIHRLPNPNINRIVRRRPDRPDR